MKPIVAVFFVDENNYSKLQKTSPREFTLPYERYTDRVERCNRDASSEITPVKAYIDIDKFTDWCTASKVNPDDAVSRAAYAAEVLGRSSSHTDSFVIDS